MTDTDELISIEESSGNRNQNGVWIKIKSWLSAPSEDGLGSFNGVFAPVSLSMFSSLLFLRIGYIIGNAGYLEAILQLLIAYSILFFTVLSISAIATNGAIKGGGVYYMISRTLGPEIGGSIGILFYFANVASSALYGIACTESLISSFGSPNGILYSFLPTEYSILYSVGINGINLMICLIGAKLFGKTTSLVLVSVISCTLLVIASYFSNFVIEFPFKNSSISGNFTGISSFSSWSDLWSRLDSNLYSSYEQDCHDNSNSLSFPIVFAVLFSGVTGIMAGANLSGELKVPSRDIPSGTLRACFFTFLTYFIIFTLTSLTCSQSLLWNDCMFMLRFNFWPPSVLIGTLLATFCASTSNLIGASRVLDAVVKDTMFGVILEWISYGTYRKNPLLAVFVTWFFINFIFLSGGVNTISQFVAILFLLSYASVNLACFGLSLASTPNFRPTFRYFGWFSALLGLLGTLIMMFLINAVISIICILICFIFVMALSLFSPSVKDHDWGSISQALLFHQVRKYLLLLDPRKDHVKFWRPQVLLFVSNPRKHCSLIQFGNALKKGGLYVLAHVYLSGNENNEKGEDVSLKEIPIWLSLIDHLKIKAFVETTVAPSLRDGIRQLVRLSGLGAMKPNTVLFGFFTDDEDENDSKIDDLGDIDSKFYNESLDFSFPPLGVKNSKSQRQNDYIGILHDMIRLRKNICICRNFDQINGGMSSSSKVARKCKYIDVWLHDFLSTVNSRPPISEDNAFLFMLQLAVIVNMVPSWKHHRLRVFIVVSVEEAEQQYNNLIAELKFHRIEGEPIVVSNQLSFQNERSLSSVNELIISYSSQTAVVFLYLPSPPPPTHPSSSSSSSLESSLPFLETQSIFLHDCNLLTRNLPPTLLVHGISPVICTSL